MTQSGHSVLRIVATQNHVRTPMPVVAKPCCNRRCDWRGPEPWGKAMRRRDFIKVVTSSAMAWSLVAHAQQPERMRRIGVLMGWPESYHQAQSWVAALREELRKLGWTEGRNIAIDTRWAAADVESMKRFAKELVALQPDLMVTGSTPATAAMRQRDWFHPTRGLVGWQVAGAT